MAASDKRARMEALAALRGGKKKDYTSQDAALYDTVTEEDYRAIVKGRLQEDDFIEDDDGSGYVDQGVDEWEQARANDRDRDSSDAESKYRKPGPSNKSQKNRKTTASEPAPSAKPPRAKPALRKAGGAAATSGLASSSRASDYHKPRPDIDDGEFMENLLGGLDAAPIALVDSRKRKGSPAYPEPVNLRMRGNKNSYASSASPSSDPAFDEDFVEKSVGGDSGASSDAEGLGGTRGPKKLRISGVEDPMEHMVMDGGPTFDMALPMDVDEEDDHQVPAPKATKVEEEEDSFAVKPLSRPTARPAAIRARPLVNARSVRAQPSSTAKPETQDEKPPLQTDNKPKPKGMAWQAALRDIHTTTDSEPSVGEQSEDDRVHETDFLADLPRKQSAAQAKRAAQAAADAQLPKPVKVEAVAADGSVRFFWLDYLEVQGVLHLFGKVVDQATGKWQSCCVTVEGIERNVFFLPRDTYTDEDGDIIEPTEDDIYDDIEEVLKSANITEFRCKPVTRKYAFEIRDVPGESAKWNKVVYGFDKPALPMNIHGKTFSRAFGTNTTAFELFVLKRKIMGPCWLNVRGAVPSQRPKPISWCKTELVVTDPKLVNPFPDTDPNAPKEAPPLTIASISVRDIMNHKENQREIVCVTLRLWNEANLEDTRPFEHQPSIAKTFVRPLDGWPQGFEDACRKQTKSKVLLARQEAALLNNMLGTLALNDPDVLVGHELSGVALDVLLHRMRDLKTAHWSRIGRFRRDKVPSLKLGGFHSYLTVGRLLCDLASDGSKSMISSTTWSLTEMVSTHLAVAREDTDPDDTFSYFESTERLMNFVLHCEADSFFQMAIANKVQILPLTKQLTNLAGNSWNQTLLGGRAQRNEYILLHEFHRQKYICPDKMSFAERRNAKALADAENGEEAEGGTKSGKKDKYKGGLVFEPKRGLWDRFILVMDFNSLYPSIIQEYNIDFTTVDRSGDHSADINWLPEVPAGDVKQGVLPRLIATLVNRRRQVKSLMKDRDTTPAKMLQYDIKQMALKLTANSMYGCLGFDGSRFYAPSLAALTTSKGREILTSTKELAENNQLDVVYGDTDSVMINTNAIDLELAKQTGKEFKKLVNERYRLLEIDIDAIFQRMLLLQKKKYAALKVDNNGERVMEVKGLDMKRREYCQLSKGASQYILNQILSGDATETVVEKIHEYLTELGQRVKDGGVGLDEFIIYKRLSKNPQDYPDAKSLPHVQVALRMKGKGGNAKSGDVIPYIFCLGEDGSSSKTAQANKARHPDDLRRPDTPFRIDYDYYLSSQVLPPVERLCDPIEGTDRPRLAGCLGLDPDRFRVAAAANEVDEFAPLNSQVPDGVRFRDAEPFHVRCRHCGAELDFRGVHQDEDNIVTSGGIVCRNKDCAQALGVASLAVQLEAQIRKHIFRLYEGWLVCDDASCGSRTRMMSVYGKRCLNAAAACRGTMHYEYTDAALYDQLLYLDTLFDPDRTLRNCSGGPRRLDEVKALLEHNKASIARLRAVASKYLEKNGRRFINMAGLFSFMRISA